MFLTTDIATQAGTMALVPQVVDVVSVPVIALVVSPMAVVSLRHLRWVLPVFRSARLIFSRHSR